MQEDTLKIVTYLAVLAVLFFSLHACGAIIDSIHYSDYIETSGVVTSVNAVIIEEFNGKYTVRKDKFSLSYTYSVDGTEYNGAMVSDDSVSTGTEIKVLYDPDDPGRSKGEFYTVWDAYEYDYEYDALYDY